MGFDLSEVLPALLESRGMTQEQLGQRAGITRTDINAIAKGKKSVGKVRLQRIADAFGVDPETLTKAGARDDGPKNPLLVRLKDIDARLTRMDDQIDGQLHRQADLLAKLGALAVRLEEAVSLLVAVAERLDPGEAEPGPPEEQQRPA